MNPKFTIVSPEEFLSTGTGVSGNPIPNNGPGRKNPYLKYVILGGILIVTVVVAYHITKPKELKLKLKKDE